MINNFATDVAQKLMDIKALLLDVDGVLTDGKIYISSSGIESKAFNVRDGHGIKLLSRAGINCGLLTGRHSLAVTLRAHELNINLVYQRCHNKLSTFAKILKRLSVEAHQIAYMGDDIVDLPVLKRVGFAATVSDAAPEVQSACDWVSSCPGGTGAVRELCELILKTQGHWDSLMQRYLL